MEALFESPLDKALKELVEREGLDWNGGSLTLRRVLSSSGRSRAFLNDEPLSLPLLGEIGTHLVDIHSQHQNIILKDSRFQLSLLDYFASNQALLSRCGAAFREMTRLRVRLSEIGATLQRMEEERDYNLSRLDQLEKARLRPGELSELEAEQKRLANAEEIKSSLWAVSSLLSPEDGQSADSLLKESARSLEKAGRWVDAARELSSRTESLRLELEDILSEAEDLAEAVELSPGRLEEVEERMSLLYGLMKKFHCSSEEELLSQRDALSKAIGDSSELEEEREGISRRLEVLTADLDASCAALTSSRKAAAGPFSQAIEASLRSLELDRARFETVVSPAPVSATGADKVTCLFSATGKDPVDVAKCASGGEISRIMLSLKAMMAAYTEMPTMIFDEIDTGVSGSAADSMGNMICRMGENMQVFAITHLPQVAAKGKTHLLVSKEVSPGGDAITTISEISGEARVQELARMLSGSAITPQAVANARALLGDGE